jgi:hypothetical protein
LSGLFAEGQALVDSPKKHEFDDSKADGRGNDGGKDFRDKAAACSRKFSGVFGRTANERHITRYK